MVTGRDSESLNCSVQHTKCCVWVEGIKLVFLACDFWFQAVLCSSVWLDMKQDVFLISDDFVLHFIELRVPGNGKLCVAVGDFGIFF